MNFKVEFSQFARAAATLVSSLLLSAIAISGNMGLDLLVSTGLTDDSAMARLYAYVSDVFLVGSAMIFMASGTVFTIKETFRVTWRGNDVDHRQD